MRIVNRENYSVNLIESESQIHLLYLVQFKFIVVLERLEKNTRRNSKAECLRILFMPQATKVPCTFNSRPSFA